MTCPGMVLFLFLLLWTSWESWLFNNYKKLSAILYFFLMLSSPSRTPIRQMLDFSFYSPCLLSIIFMYQSFWDAFWKFSSNYTSRAEGAKIKLIRFLTHILNFTFYVLYSFLHILLGYVLISRLLCKIYYF